METTLILVAGAMIVSAVVGFLLGQRRGVVIEANDSEAYIVALERTQRRLNEAEMRVRRAQNEVTRAKRRR